MEEDGLPGAAAAAAPTGAGCGRLPKLDAGTELALAELEACEPPRGLSGRCTPAASGLRSVVSQRISRGVYNGTAQRVNMCLDERGEEGRGVVCVLFGVLGDTWVGSQGEMCLRFEERMRKMRKYTDQRDRHTTNFSRLGVKFWEVPWARWGQEGGQT